MFSNRSTPLYPKEKRSTVLGDKSFRKAALKKNTAAVDSRHEKKVLIRPTANLIVTATAKVFNVSTSDILNVQIGRQKRNIPRKIAMYFCQSICDMSLQQIADTCNIKHRGGVSNALTETRRLLLEDTVLNKQTQRILNMIQ